MWSDGMKGPGKGGRGDGVNLRMSSRRENWTIKSEFDQNFSIPSSKSVTEFGKTHLAYFLVEGRQRDAHRQRRPFQICASLEDVRVLGSLVVPVDMTSTLRMLERRRRSDPAPLTIRLGKQVERGRRSLGRRRWRRRRGETER